MLIDWKEVPIQMMFPSSVHGLPVCGRPEQKDYYGDGEYLYWQRCEELIDWENQEGDVIWCSAGHEFTVTH